MGDAASASVILRERVSVPCSVILHGRERESATEREKNKIDISSGRARERDARRARRHELRLSRNE